MPTYQYVCQACDTDFEVVQSFSDPSLTVHEPGCGGPVRKRFNAVGVVFKGSGFYRTDSRGADKGAGDGGAKSETTSDSGSSAAKTDSKPAATPAASSSSSSSSTSGSSSSGSASAA